ncbi:flavin reductase (DIM6/NTAB) family NADH-FMN oxidoreductase RutF [Thermosporothrix hazakensis]|jgi:flavin reductase (DIM6/NTAB) family NADH-FMN oxidoreductase RutF|uniref:Flavin reductase (DIM6/NTAB) family NADH-FMN oxidoreductase RutF n=2 Tax=Thermosporothrix TaxID=768650 RepID=A0A326UBG4_THEHA|nr:flavin reductase family protein [Thermosporothrix hazakensis]PZW34430.1 flavin reductase (DIM6/NTAB) family NADH-FMN oxidoreductase RutF [Thermosporothrix hazakensis]BBH85552.1 flavin reductase [Thermosporothrix sp. COM3]GCE46021.1 flavin reductase [Thermosporothrix hazakensis]
MHRTIQPTILYFGTPVVLISTVNEDGTSNLAPMSSAWWLNQSCMLGLGTRSRTVENLRRERECVLNLPSADLVSAVNRLAMLTGKNPVPESKAKLGYTYEPEKFRVAGLTPEPSELVAAPRVAECPVQLEAVVKQMHAVDGDDSHLVAIETRIVRVHIDERLLKPGEKQHIDPEKWNPLIMSFCEFFGLSEKLHPSKLADTWLTRLYEKSEKDNEPASSR